MNKKKALIFGYNKYSLEIANHVREKYEAVELYTQDLEKIQNNEFNLAHYDLSDDWSSLQDRVDIEKSIAFCALEDDAENIFLTISLRANFTELDIIAIASNKENAQKLKMAGANRVIPIVESTADIIANILELPVSNKVLQGILFEENDLKIAQVKMGKNSEVLGEKILQIDWSRYHGIIILSLMRVNMKNEFIHSSKVRHHVLEHGDTLVVVGYERDLVEFKKLIGSE